jgi:nucleotide-binding universal stress UspA family protein
VAGVFDDVLIGVDGRGGGSDAIALAVRLASQRAKLGLAHVYGAGLMPGRGAALLLASEREQARVLLERARAEASLDAELFPCAERSIGLGLRQLATSHGCDLLVVGRRHHGLFGRAFHSDDTSAALNGTPCPIAVAPPGFAERRRGLGRIGVGYDGSPESEEALEVAGRLAARGDGATVRAVAVVDEHRSPPELDTGAIACEALSGYPSEVLEGFSQELDLLIVGSRSHGPAGRLFNGSTSNHLARNSGCALLILPRGTVPLPVCPDGAAHTAAA